MGSELSRRAVVAAAAAVGTSRGVRGSNAASQAGPFPVESDETVSVDETVRVTPPVTIDGTLELNGTLTFDVSDEPGGTTDEDATATTTPGMGVVVALTAIGAAVWRRVWSEDTTR